MSQAQVDGLTINYDVQGGRAVPLIPYTSADHACWAFQLPAHTEHFKCIAIDLPVSGESDKPGGLYSAEGQADEVSAFLGVIGVERAHVAGMSFGGANSRGNAPSSRFPDSYRNSCASASRGVTARRNLRLGRVGFGSGLTLSSRQAVRYAGMDITVHQSDQRRAPGHLSRQRAARFALGAVRGRTANPAADDEPGSRLLRAGSGADGGSRACLSVARKLLTRSYHTLRELGEEALQPA
jgi:pimeloyl-ACP methyl ester carboxylesterase